MAATPKIKYLRVLSDPRFTTVTEIITYAQMDSTLVGLKDDIDALALVVSLISTHTANTDRFLQQGLSQEFDSNKFRRGYFTATEGDNTIIFTDSVIPIFSDTNFLFDCWGWDVDGNKVLGTITSKSNLEVVVYFPVACRAEWIAFV